MSRITVVGTARSRPGREADVARAAAEQLDRGGAAAAGRSDAYVFQDDGDPGLFVYVARWASRAAFEGYFRGFGQFGESAWYAEPPMVRFYAPFAAYEEVAAPSAALSLALAAVPPAAAPAARARLLAYRHEVDAHALGAVEYEFGESPDGAGLLLAFARWRTPAHRHAYRAGDWVRLAGELTGLGAAIRLFGGPQRAGTAWDAAP
jgi:quinol monooxygenase YgiN